MAQNILAYPFSDAVLAESKQVSSKPGKPYSTLRPSKFLDQYKRDSTPVGGPRDRPSEVFLTISNDGVARMHEANALKARICKSNEKRPKQKTISLHSRLGPRDVPSPLRSKATE